MTQCQYCESEALAAGNADPPMCAKHLVIAQVVTRIQTWGWELTVQGVQNFIYFNGVPDVALDEVPALCASMPEFQDVAQD